MYVHTLWKLCAFLVFSTVLNVSDGALVELYNNNELSGLFYRQELKSTSCVNLPSHLIQETRSLSAERCTIFYSDADCSGFRVRLQGRRNYIEISALSGKLASFQLCPDTYDQGLRVTLYNNPGFKDIAIEYLDIGMGAFETRGKFVGSIDTHGNCVRLIMPQGPDVVLHPDRTIDFALANNFSKTVHGIGTCLDYSYLSDSWFRASIFKFEVTPDPTAVVRLSSTINVELAAKTTLINNGSATVSQEYVATRSVTESIDMNLPEGFAQTREGSVENTVDVQVSTSTKFWGIGFESSVRDSLTTAWSWSEEESREYSQKYTRQETREFSVQQKIEIPPCSLYEVSSMVKVTKNYLVDYIVHSKVSGDRYGNPLSLQDIKKWLDLKPSLEYAGDYDESTVIVKSRGKMITDFGVDAIIDGAGSRISGCQV